MKTMFAVVLCFCLMGCASAPVPVPSESSENLVSTHEPTQAEPSSDLCQDVAGCLHADGRHIPQNFSKTAQIQDMTRECMWHWHNAIPRDTASSCVFGDCVLPGADNVVPISTASDRPSPFLCDADTCECGIVPPAICQRNKVCVDELKSCSPLHLSQHCPLLVQPTQEPFDPRVCSGGRLICRGIDNASMTRPNDQDTWECRNVSTVPDDLQYAAQGRYKAWVCAQTEGCTCKDVEIALNEPCF